MLMVPAIAEPPAAVTVVAALGSATASSPNPVASPIWLRKPSEPEVARYYPPAARNQSLSGYARLDCTLTRDGTLAGCSAWTRPEDHPGFAGAALKLAPSFRLKPTDGDGANIEGRSIRIPIWFRLATHRAPDVVLSQPALPNGMADVDCRATPSKTVDNCIVLRAEPPGAGIDELALQFTARLMVNTAQQTRVLQRFIFRTAPAASP
jgi:TonB family protein